MKRFDFDGVLKRLSTWLGVLAGATGGAAAAYIALPADWQAHYPVALAKGMAMTSVLCGFLTPVATSFRQKGLRKDAD